jgi:hypothetical protein
LESLHVHVGELKRRAVVRRPERLKAKLTRGMRSARPLRYRSPG